MIVIAIMAVELGYYRFYCRPLFPATTIMFCTNDAVRIRAMQELGSPSVLKTAAAKFDGGQFPIFPEEIRRHLRLIRLDGSRGLRVELNTGRPATDTLILDALCKTYEGMTPTPPQTIVREDGTSFPMDIGLSRCRLIATIPSKPVPITVRLVKLLTPTAVMVALAIPYIQYRVDLAKRSRQMMEEPAMVTS